MNKSILVADSGGTQTDWCYVNLDGEREYFTTKSFHPSNWSETFELEFKEYWSKKEYFKRTALHFYGAGCLNKNNKIQLANYFKKWGFEDVAIFSDVEGAGHALLGDKKGTIAILGTGSVVAHFDGDGGFEINGGLGYILGDEGSGYYFGKLLVSELLNGVLSEELSNLLFELIGDRETILQKVYGEAGRTFLSSIAFLLKDLDYNSSLNEFHTSNIQLFSDKYLSERLNLQEISIVGSYGFNNQKKIIEILQLINVKLQNCIQYPIVDLTDYVLKSTF